MALDICVKMKQHVVLLCLVIVCGLGFVSSDTQQHDSGRNTNGDSNLKGSGKSTDPAKYPGNNVPVGDTDVQHQGKPPATTADRNDTNCDGNSTTCKNGSKGYFNKLSDLYEKGTIKRAFYVLIGITGIVVIYFIVRTVRSRSKRSKSKKYGVISMPGNDLEMAPLDADDEEDDVTVFEVNGHK